MTMLGGLGTIAGPVIGAVIVYWLQDILWANFYQFHLIIQGVALIIIVLFVPDGIMGASGDKSAVSLGWLWRGRSRQKDPAAEVRE